LIAAVLLAVGVFQGADFGGETDYEPCEPIMTAPDVDMKCVDGDWVDQGNDTFINVYNQSIITEVT